MRLHMTNSGAITLIAPSHFKQFEILVDEQPSASLDRAIARVGQRADDEHIWVNPQVIRFLSGKAGDADWEAGFDAMVGFARKFNWVNEAGLIRAHIVRNERADSSSVEDFKAAMRMLAAGVSAITTGDVANPSGMVVSSLTAISAEPPLVGFFVHRDSSMLEPLKTHAKFVANILGHTHEGVATNFLKKPQGCSRFAEGQWGSGLDGLPILADALANVECHVIHTTTLGTHEMFVGKIRKTTTGASGSPMVNFNAGMRALVQ
ncbi:MULTISPECIES: flavin reductase family protein [Paraburkholderia]|jgi:flavin reductase (DIM6/NTAB) family NADH-FMN oxidoreductase RutF|uniref:Flavin reductase family protein n=1 Tax=Paraburkholderia strydomiana TaxID=1245417 RepID=A0ABW9CAX3_9BURK|nr:flavin reductase family protein [Paraburkholderia caledonica]TCF99780.1 flavin reductase [Paraburkholderia strydomiana]